jgi:hypothetical protein
MTATNQTVRNYQAGDDVRLEVTVTDEDGSAVDLSGATVVWGLARRPTADAALVEKSTDTGGITITDAASGEFAIEVEATDTEGLEGTFYHEAELTDSGGSVSTVLTGQFVIDDELV